MLETHKRRATKQRLMSFAEKVDGAGAVAIGFLEAALSPQAIFEPGVMARRSDETGFNGRKPEFLVFKTILPVVVKAHAAAEHFR
jgi:hypothetical protein